MIVSEQAKQYSKAIREAVDALNAVVSEATKDGMLVELSVTPEQSLMSRPSPLVVIDNLAIHIGYLR